MTVYLASPYSHPDPAVRQVRFREACRAAAALMHSGRSVFSPIAHGHPICELGVPSDWTKWQELDQRILRQCDEVVVLMLDGWRVSRGVQAEIDHAIEMDMPVRYLPLGEVFPLLRRGAPAPGHRENADNGA